MATSVAAFSSVAFSTVTASEAAGLPPISAAGHCRPLCPPKLRDAGGAFIEPRLLQVQTVFRHGARLPVDDDGCRDGLCAWTAEDTDKSAQLAAYGRVEMFQHGSGDPINPAAIFGKPKRTLRDGGAPGGLSPLGLQHGVDFGQELRARYVDPEATSCADVRPGYLLPASWSRARRLVQTRSTRVERTVYTAVGVVNGLYPSDGSASAAPPYIEIALSSSSPQVQLVAFRPIQIHPIHPSI